MTSNRWVGDGDGAAEPEGFRAPSTGPDPRTGAADTSTSALLRHLLSTESRYRRRWRAAVRRASSRDPHQSAVAAVLADHRRPVLRLHLTDQVAGLEQLRRALTS